MKKTERSAAPRVTLYIRVSTEEQVMRGYSLEAQREALESYAKAHGMIIVDFYQDEGKSARKSYRTRPECMRLLRDVEAGKIDLILFIKLDRWFRSVGDYYEVQRILDAHGVHWQAILEDYEAVTSSGQFKVNIMRPWRRMKPTVPPSEWPLCLTAKSGTGPLLIALQKKLCKSRQAIVKKTGANQGVAQTGHCPA